MAKFLRNKVALVTGGGRGIGRAVASLLAEEGAAVVVNDDGAGQEGTGASRKLAESTVAEITAAGGRAAAAFEDVSSMSGAEKAVDVALKTFGKLDIVVVAHVIARDGSILDVSEADWDRVIDVDLKGAFNVVKNACICFRQQRNGRVILIGAQPEAVPNPGQVTYTAAQGGVAGLTRVCCLDMDRYGATVNCICPAGRSRRPEGGQSQPVDNARDAAATAALAGYLASDLGATVNGHFFLVDGDAVSALSPAWPIASICKQDRWTLEELDAIAPRTVAPRPSVAAAARGQG